MWRDAQSGAVNEQGGVFGTSARLAREVFPNLVFVPSGKFPLPSDGNC